MRREWVWAKTTVLVCGLWMESEELRVCECVKCVLGGKGDREREREITCVPIIYYKTGSEESKRKTLVQNTACRTPEGTHKIERTS